MLDEFEPFSGIPLEPALNCREAVLALIRRSTCGLAKPIRSNSGSRSSATPSIVVSAFLDHHDDVFGH